MSNYTIKYAEGTGKLQGGYYTYNESTDSMMEEDRWIGPWRTEREAVNAVRKAEQIGGEDDCEVDDALISIAVEASKTQYMLRASAIHECVRLAME